MVLRYRLFALSCLIQLNTTCNTKHSMRMVYDLRDFVIVVYNNRAFRSLYRSIEVFSSFLAMAGLNISMNISMKICMWRLGLKGLTLARLFMV